MSAWLYSDYSTRINSAGALLAGRGQYRTRTVKNGTRMRYGSAVGLLISCRVQMGGILLVLVLVLVALYWDRGTEAGQR